MSENERLKLNDFLNNEGGDQEISKNTAGYGLGLFISNKLAESLS